MEIFWTDEARSTFDRIKTNIQERFSEKEVDQFVLETLKTIKAIDAFPKSFPISKIRKYSSTRKALIHPHSTLFYRITTKKQITLVTFWDNRNNPKKLR